MQTDFHILYTAVMNSSTAPYTFTSKQINPDVLFQALHWYDGKGKLHKISEMEHFHCKGAMRKLKGAFGYGVIDTPVFLALQRRYFDTKS